MAGRPGPIVVCGLPFEARLLADLPVTVVSGLDPQWREVRIRNAIDAGATGILSWGTAAGLDPMMRPGSVLCADIVLGLEESYVCDLRWTARLRERLPGVRPGSVFGTEAALMGPREKRSLFSFFGARAADMESLQVARLARRYNLPFVVCRVVLDPAWQAVPPLALAGLRPDGSTDLRRLLQELSRRPRELAPLLQIARHALTAHGALKRVRDRIGPALTTPEAGLDTQPFLDSALTTTG